MGTWRDPLGFVWKKGPLKPQQHLPALGTQWTHREAQQKGLRQWAKVEAHILRLLLVKPFKLPAPTPLQVPRQSLSL